MDGEQTGSQCFVCCVFVFLDLDVSLAFATLNKKHKKQVRNTWVGMGGQLYRISIEGSAGGSARSARLAGTQSLFVTEVNEQGCRQLAADRHSCTSPGLAPREGARARQESTP